MRTQYSSLPSGTYVCRTDERREKKSYYLPRNQLEELLKSVGVTVAGDTSTDLIAYCPFHINRDSPAFNITLKGPHLWKCHNGKCNKSGNIITLLTMKGFTFSEAEKMVLKGAIEVNDLLAIVEDIFKEDKKDAAAEQWSHINPEKFRDSDEEHGYPARLYLQGRGITQEAYEYFRMGFSPAKRMLVIPVFEPRGGLVGVIGREIESKRYQYSTGLGRGQLVWNLNNAKRHDAVILTEGALDAVYVWQAGYENVGAVFGSSISPNQWRELRRYFTEIICFFDNDEAGQGLTDSIIRDISDLAVSTVRYPDRFVPDGNGGERPIKDPGELSVEEIQQMVENRISSLSFLLEGV